MEASIPVYLTLGFLESGKTTLLQETLDMDYFDDGERTVLIRCEDGEEEYDEVKLSKHNVRVIPVEDMSELTTPFLDEIDRRYQPQRVLLEYNGMWPVDTLRNLDMPKEWGLYQVIMCVDSTTFGLYLNNMPSQIMDMVTEADMVVFNRATNEMPLLDWKRALRATNRDTDIVFEGEEDEIQVPEIIPYDTDGDTITINDDDYGIFYLDIMDHPEKYEGKTLNFRGLVLVGDKMPKGIFVPGRNVMTCCEDDIRFFGLICKYAQASKLKKGQWANVSATVHWEHSDGYNGEGPVLTAKSVTPADAPEESLVQFR